MENPELQKQIEVEASRHEISIGEKALVGYTDILAEIGDKNE